MRIDGKIVKWNDDRGFGFIKPTHGEQEVFAHISAFPDDGHRPKIGERVSYTIEADKTGKKRAIAIVYSERAKVSRNHLRSSERPCEKRSLLSRLMPVFLVVIVLYGYGEYSQLRNDVHGTKSAEKTLDESSSTPASLQSKRSTEASPSDNSDTELASAYKNQTSHLQIEGSGRVTAVLSDDNEGGRHQRFIARLNSGQTLLVVHNIDVAPRISSLTEGDTIKFYGQYEWNEKGGVIHWTHNDPSGSHVTGWIEHNGQRYQ